MAGENRDPAGADRVTALERRSRLLLRAYPAAYRRERGEEILGTLLEATQAERTWPRLSDARALVSGGLKARAAQNKRLTTGANLRVAVMVGVALYLAVCVASYLSSVASEAAFFIPSPGGLVLGTPPPPTAPGWPAWPAVLTGLSVAATVVLAWTAPRLVVLTGALPAAAFLSYLVLEQPYLVGPAAIQLASLAALAALIPRIARPSRRWLWLLGAIAATALLPILGVDYANIGNFERLMTSGVLVLVFGVVSIVWIGIDARLAVAFLTYFTLTVMESEAGSIVYGPGLSWLFPLLVAAPIAAPALWLLRRQSGRAAG